MVSVQGRVLGDGVEGLVEAEAGPDLPEVILESVDRSLLRPQSPSAHGMGILLAAVTSRRSVLSPRM